MTALVEERELVTPQHARAVSTDKRVVNDNARFGHASPARSGNSQIIPHIAGK